METVQILLYDMKSHFHVTVKMMKNLFSAFEFSNKKRNETRRDEARHEARYEAIRPVGLVLHNILLPFIVIVVAVVAFVVVLSIVVIAVNFTD